MFEKLGQALLTWGIEHQSAVGLIFLAFLLSSGIVNALRYAYPEYVTRPAWARLVVGFLDPFTGNLWRLLIWASAKVGIVLKGPKDDGSGEIQIPTGGKP